MSEAAQTTFCFTDIEGSTQLFATVGEERYTDLLERHRAIVRDALRRAGGREVRTAGDGFFLSFSDGDAALSFAVEAQRALTAESWPDGQTVRVRIGLHRGLATLRDDGDYIAIAVHEAARVGAVARGGQVLVTEEAATTAPPDGCKLIPLGRYRLRDVDRPLELFAVAGPRLVESFAPVRAARDTAGLPLPRSPIVGRDAELAAVSAALPTAPLLKLVGSGGVGKTRLALEAASRAAAAHPDGVFLVELSSISDPALVVGAVATRLAVPTLPGENLLDALVDHLGERSHLIVFDSCEGVLDGVATVADTLAQRCPGTTILATSLEAVRTADERVITVEPLADAAAVRLLAARVEAAGATLGPDDSDALGVIARRLDGIPLALELAAARVNELGVDVVVEGLDDRFDLLTGGLRTALPRHRTLEAAVQWAAEGLDAEERRMLSHLSQLLGRWTPADALEVVGSGDTTADRSRLDRLIRRSLVILDGDPVKVRLLDTIRLFGARELGDEDRRAIAGRRLTALSRLAEAQRGLPESTVLREIEDLIADVRALADPASCPDPETAAGVLAMSLAWFEYRGLFAEALELVEPLLAVVAEGPERALLLATSGNILSNLGQQAESVRRARVVLATLAASPRARAIAILHLNQPGIRVDADTPSLDEALALVPDDIRLQLAVRGRMAVARAAAGDPKGAAADFTDLAADADAVGATSQAVQAMVNHGSVLVWARDLDGAEAALRKGRERALDERLVVLAASALHGLATIALHRGDALGAIELAEERLTLADRMGDTRAAAPCLNMIATAALQLGDYTRARQANERTLEALRATGASDGVVVATFNLAVLCTHVEGGLAPAGRWAAECARVAMDAPAGPLQALGVLAAAGVGCLAGDADGPELVAAAMSVPGDLPLDPADHEWIARCEQAAVLALGDDAVARARAAGEQVDITVALARAAALADRVAAATS